MSQSQIVPFDESHVTPFCRWFNALPNNNVWTESSVCSRTIHDPSYDPQLMVALERDGIPVGFLLASIANDTGWVRAFLVHPEYQRMGLGTAMFDTVEGRLARRGVQEVNVGWSLPRYFLPGIDISYTPAIVFLDRRGYHTNRETRVNMQVRLDRCDLNTASEQVHLAQQGITVRRAQLSDVAGITDLCARNQSPGWAVETLAGLDSSPPTVFVAECEGQVRAFATHSVCGPIHFGPMLTDPELQGQGVGTVLLKCCLADWQRVGVSRCEIVWAGPVSFYARAVHATICKGFWTFHRMLDENN